MAITYGFYNSMNGDRKYDAVQLSSIFDGVIRDGVFQSIGGYLATKPGTGMQVLVSPGKAWFDHTWTVNDALYPLVIGAPDPTLKRYDAVVLETDGSKPIRKNSIKIVRGTPSADPKKPTMKKEEFLNQHALAYVLVNPGVSSIQEKDIELVVGQDECPFVTSILESVSIEALLAKWENEFRVWFDDLQAQMEGNVAANLQSQITALDARVTPLETLGGRVETNTYNIAMLALLHAKSGEFPPNTKKMIVHVSGQAYSIRDYCGVTPDATALRSTVGKYPTKNTSAKESIYGVNYIRYKGKYIWQDDSINYAIYESSDLNGLVNKKTLLDKIYTRQNGVSYYILNGKLRIGILSQLSSWSDGNASVKIYEYDGEKITLKTEHKGIYCNNVNAYYQSVAIDSEKAFYTYNTGDNDYNGHGGVLLDDGSHMSANGIGREIISRVNSPTGLYVGTRGNSTYPTSDSYIRFVSRSGVTPVTMPENDLVGPCVLYNGKAFFAGSRGIYVENGKNSFSKIAFPDTGISNGLQYGHNAIFFVYKNKLYFMSPGGKHAYRFDGENFVQDDELYHVFGYTSHPQMSLPSEVLYDEYGNQLGLKNGSTLYEHTFSENGVYETIDYDVGSFGYADIHIGGNLSGYSVKVSTDGGTSWKVPKETSVKGAEIRAHFDGLEGTSLSVRVEFDLGSGYIDYIVGGVY